MFKVFASKQIVFDLDKNNINPLIIIMKQILRSESALIEMIKENFEVMNRIELEIEQYENITMIMENMVESTFELVNQIPHDTSSFSCRINQNYTIIIMIIIFILFE